MHRLLPVVLFAAGYAVPGDAPAVPLAELARAVAQADALARQDFALVALDEMVVAYRAEADRVHAVPPRRVEAGKTARWSSGTSEYASQLESMTERARVAESVEIHVDATDSLLLVIDGSAVAITGPRIAEPGLLDGAIVARFCRLHDCAWLLELGDSTNEPVAPPPPPLPFFEWEFSDRGGAVCRTGDGFEFQFRDLANLDGRRAACAMVVDEFRRIAQRLDALRATGVLIDLQRLAISPDPDTGGHLLTLNAGDERTSLALPALARIRGLLRFGLLWLDAQRRGVPGSLLLSNAGATLSPAVEMAASGGVGR